MRSKMQAKILESKNELITFLELNNIEMLPGLNIQEPWCSMLLSGEKIIETRGYDCPEGRRGVFIGAVATQRTMAPKSALIGLIRITGTKRYSSEVEFSKDENRHRVTHDSIYWFKDGIEKWGWEIEVVAVMKTPIVVNNRRGIVWTQNLVF